MRQIIQKRCYNHVKLADIVSVATCDVRLTVNVASVETHISYSMLVSLK